MSKGQSSTDAGEYSMDDYSRKYYVAAVVLVGLMILMIIGLWTKLPKEVPLFFSKPWGESRLAVKQWLLLLPGLSLLIIATNVMLGRFFHQYNKIVIKSLATVAAIASLMLSISLLGIFWSIL